MEDLKCVRCDLLGPIVRLNPAEAHAGTAQGHHDGLDLSWYISRSYVCDFGELARPLSIVGPVPEAVDLATGNIVSDGHLRVQTCRQGLPCAQVRPLVPLYLIARN